MKFSSLLLPLLSLLPATYAQQFAGDTINNSLPLVPGSEITYFRVADPQGKNNNLTLINYSSLQTNGNRLAPSMIQRVVIIIHGLARDPGTYMSNMLSALSITTPNYPDVNFSSVQIVCPYFPNGNDKNFGYPWTPGLAPGLGSTSNALVWYGSNWSAGANNQYPYPNSISVSSYLAIDQMIKYFDNKALYPNLKQIVIGGHSMGGQFVNRYAEVGIPLNTQTPVSYWIANPDSYAWMSTSRPLDTSTCPIYDNWREGFTNYTQYPMHYQTTLAKNRTAVLANYNSKSKNYARGTQDLGDDASTCAPYTTGQNRNERFFNFIKAFPPVCSSPVGGQCDTVDYVNANHDAGAMMESAAGQARLFLDNWSGNGTRAYDFGYPREAAGDDPLPNPAMNGTYDFSNNNVYAGNMTYQGCWSEVSTGGSTLSYLAYSIQNNTIEGCVSYCLANNYTVAGLEFGSQCHCGDYINAHASQTVDNACTADCTGNSTEICGDYQRLSLFSNGKPYQPPIPGTPEFVGNYQASLCYTEGTSSRALTGSGYTDNNNMTLENCASFCNGYPYFGTEYSTQCYCGSYLNAGAVVATDGTCNMPCAGNLGETCGGPNRLNIYSLTVGAPVSTITQGATSAGGGAAPATPTSTIPAYELCPATNGGSFSNAGSSNYTITCSSDTTQGAYNGVSAPSSYLDCFGLCDADSAKGCVGFVYLGAAGGGGSGTCWLKSGAGNLIPQGTNYIAGFKKGVIPGPPASTSTTTAAATTPTTSAQSIPTSMLCPAAGGQAIQDGNGNLYTVTCNSDSSQGSYTGVSATNSYLDCMTLCDSSASSGCQGFVYVGGQNGLGGGACWLKTAMGTYTPAGSNYIAAFKGVATPSAPASTGSTSSTTGTSSTSISSTTTTTTTTTTTSSSATPTVSISCPASNGTTYTSVNGDKFLIECGIDHSAGDMGSTGSNTFAGCVEDCANTAGCVDVSYSGYACYMKSSVGAPVYNGVWGARLIPASGASTTASTTVTSTPTTMVTTASTTPTTTTTPTSTTTTSTTTTSTTTSTTTTTTTTTTAAPSSTALPSGFAVVGCFQDTGARVLPYLAYANSSNTPQQCASACQALGYQYAGTEYSSQCFCGNYAPPTSEPSTDCSMTCSGDSSQLCGGPNRLSVLINNNWQPTFFVRQQYSTWNLMSCYSDSGTRTLPAGIAVPGGSSNMTSANCLSTCAAQGYTYCGTEYYGECWASNTMPSSSLALSGDPLQQGCTFPCNGNSTEACGGANRILVYVNNGTSPASSFITK